MGRPWTPGPPSLRRGQRRASTRRAVVLVLVATCVGAVCSSAAVATKPPAPPRSIDVRSISKTSIVLAWAATPGGAAHGVRYRVYVNGALRAAVRGTSYRIEGLKCGTSYSFGVRASDAHGRDSNLRSRRISTTPCSGDCFASPGQCGYPDPARGNVGVPAGTTLKPSGSITVTKNGAVVSGVDVSGFIDVRANNVRIENSRIRCNCAGDFAIHEPNGYSGLTVKDSEISGGNIYAGGGAGGMNSFLRVYMHDCDECIQYDSTITDSYLYIGQAVAGAHYEGIYNGDGTTDIQHSTILNPHSQTAAVFMNTSGGAGGACRNHLTINNSLLAGGGFLVYPCGNANSAGSSTTVITNNRFARCTSRPVVDAASGRICQGFGSPAGDGDAVGTPDAHGYYPRGGFFGVDAYIYCGSTTWSNNVWDDNSAAVSC
jgi:hypothetical protein